MERIVITGGTGFIGSWLIRELVQNHVEVVALVRNIGTAELDNLKIISS